MAFSLGDGDENGMNEMNLIPLIDIMLVLMIIFLVTATVTNPSVPLTLPKTSATEQPPEPKKINISIDAQNAVYWNNEKLSLEEIRQRLQEAGQAEEKPVLLLEADKDSRYETLAKIMADASQAELSNLSFVSKTE